MGSLTRGAIAALALIASACGPDPRLVRLEQRVAAQDARIADLHAQITAIHVAADRALEASLATQTLAHQAKVLTEELSAKESPIVAMEAEYEQLKREKLLRESNEHGVSFRGKPASQH